MLCSVHHMFVSYKTLSVKKNIAYLFVGKRIPFLDCGDLALPEFRVVLVDFVIYAFCADPKILRKALVGIVVQNHYAPKQRFVHSIPSFPTCHHQCKAVNPCRRPEGRFGLKVEVPTVSDSGKGITSHHFGITPEITAAFRGYQLFDTAFAQEALESLIVYVRVACQHNKHFVGVLHRSSFLSIVSFKTL